MKIQLALDRYSVEEAIQLTKDTEHFVDWIEVGTSLIKEYGVESIKMIKKSFPHKVIVADIKTIDNATYEFDMCFRAGADVATVMGVSPIATIKACIETANKTGKKVMIDLLNTSEGQKNELLQFKSAIFCSHVSKDEQELTGKKNNIPKQVFDPSIELAIAGGITLESVSDFKALKPAVIIIGSAITKVDNPREAAEQFKKIITNCVEESTYENNR